MVSKKKNIPLYVKLKEQIKEEIKTNKYNKGSKFPPERILLSIYRWRQGNDNFLFR